MTLFEFCLQDLLQAVGIPDEAVPSLCTSLAQSAISFDAHNMAPIVRTAFEVDRRLRADPEFAMLGTAAIIGYQTIAVEPTAIQLCGFWLHTLSQLRVESSRRSSSLLPLWRFLLGPQISQQTWPFETRELLRLWRVDAWDAIDPANPERAASIPAQFDLQNPRSQPISQNEQIRLEPDDRRIGQATLRADAEAVLRIVGQPNIVDNVSRWYEVANPAARLAWNFLAWSSLPANRWIAVETAALDSLNAHCVGEVVVPGLTLPLWWLLPAGPWVGRRAWPQNTVAC